MASPLVLGFSNHNSKILPFCMLINVVVRACYGAYIVAHIFKYLAPNFASG